MRVLYFDINGVLLNYDDQPKPALLNGELQTLLQEKGFTRLVCVSGWCDVVSEPILRILESDRLLALYDIVRALFPDRSWFLQNAELEPTPITVAGTLI